MSKRDGGPAFPVGHNQTTYTPSGMSLRDYLAAASMPVIGYRMEMLNANWAATRIALVAYQIADAMIEARDQEDGICEHGFAEGDFCEACNKEYKEASANPENGNGD